jgi:transglutaminase-like putative cysteine protease
MTGEHGTTIVSCELAFAVLEPSEVVLHLMASASAGTVTAERFDVACNGQPTEAVELGGPHGARIQLLEAPTGRLGIHYRAEIDPERRSPLDIGEPNDPRHIEETRLIYLRPSRYCPSDHLVGFAVAEFGLGSPVSSRVAAITEWIRERIGYVAGSSSVHDSAEHTLLTGMGTCRDFAHLGIALCRGLGIPARFASVYAPGLTPMDFHAVFEAWVDGRWVTHDTTGLAPRQSMVRIGTGRDAADAAFASVTRGVTTLEYVEVSAATDGLLPVDDSALAFTLP